MEMVVLMIVCLLAFAFIDAKYESMRRLKRARIRNDEHRDR